MNGVKVDTIIRTVILLIALVNQVLVSTGHPIIKVDNELVTELVTNLITIGAAVWSWWKNNSFTYEALIADEQLREMKGDK